ncbi:MAG: ChbG/HpnK family deacetylase [Cryomorphaceae bacterium]
MPYPDQSKPVRQLLVTADDYGVHDTIDNGILECLENLDCIDIIVTHASSEARIKALIQRDDVKARLADGTLKLGLHLNLNVGKPMYRDTETSEGTKYLSAISKIHGRYSKEGSNFKHKSAAGILLNITRISSHHNALKKEIKAQYDAFRSYAGSKPTHVSSHSGVFSGHPKMYRILKEACKELDNLAIRCPSIINYDADLTGYEDIKKWVKFEQYLLTRKQLRQMLASPTPGSNRIRSWMLRNQRKAFDMDRSNNEVRSTDFFVTQLYLQGEPSYFNKIIKFIEAKGPEDNKDYSYEVVAHPMSFERKSEYADMPDGIQINDVFFNKRRKEGRTLRSEKHSLWKHKLDHAGITKFEL